MNKKKCILTVGVSGSGKSSWAKEYIFKKRIHEENWVNINRDDIRKTVFNSKYEFFEFTWHQWEFAWEKEVKQIWENIINRSIQDTSIDGVIISDTNLNKKTRQYLIDKFTENNFDVELKLFPITYEEAIKNDLKRPESVGAIVIGDQIVKYWEQFEERYIPDTSLPKAVIVDIDGTIAHHHDRGPFDLNKVLNDIPDLLVIDIIRGLKNQGYKIIILSGRENKCQELTEQWLTIHLQFDYDLLLMRKTDDNRRDSIIKRELFNEVISKYQIVGVFDDRPQVISECWLPLGLKVLSVGNPYNFF